MLNILSNFIENRKQRVVLNGQCSSWATFNDLSSNLQCNHKLFADDTPLFSTVRKSETTTDNLNSDLKEISEWVFQWKMNFNPDPSRQAPDVIFNRKTTTVSYPKIFFINIQDSRAILDSKLTFGTHIKSILAKINQTIGLIRKFQRDLPGASLVTMYKAFVTPHLDHGDIIFDQTFNDSFHRKMESIQYEIALAITRTIRATLKEKFYQQLRFE